MDKKSILWAVVIVAVLVLGYLAYSNWPVTVPDAVPSNSQPMPTPVIPTPATTTPTQ